MATSYGCCFGYGKVTMTYLIPDSHIHLRTHICPQPKHQLHSYIEEAEKKNVLIGIREHAPLPKAYCFGPQKDAYFSMQRNELQPFLDLFIEKPVYVGLEVDFLPGFEDEIAEIIACFEKGAKERQLKIAGITGSVHFLPCHTDHLPKKVPGLNEILFDYNEETFCLLMESVGVEQVMHHYFDRIMGAIKSKLFDNLGHLELIRKYDAKDSNGHRHFFSTLEQIYDQRCMEVIETIAHTPMALEYNASGFDHPYGEAYLSKRLICKCSDHQIPITYASDAHKPSEMGRYFDKFRESLKEVGYGQCAFHIAREIVFYPLESDLKEGIDK